MEIYRDLYTKITVFILMFYSKWIIRLLNDVCVFQAKNPYSYNEKIKYQRTSQVFVGKVCLSPTRKLNLQSALLMGPDG